jgi:hypothetical protein
VQYQPADSEHETVPGSYSVTATNERFYLGLLQHCAERRAGLDFFQFIQVTLHSLTHAEPYPIC